MSRSKSTPNVNTWHDDLEGIPHTLVVDARCVRLWHIERDGTETTVIVKRCRAAAARILRGRDLPVGVTSHATAVAWARKQAIA